MARVRYLGGGRVQPEPPLLVHRVKEQCIPHLATLSVSIGIRATPRVH